MKVGMAMGGHGVQVALVVVLVLVNAAFAGSEMALVSLRDTQVRRLARASATGRVLESLARQPNRFLATVQIGITLAGFLASAVAAVSLAEPFFGPLGFLGSAAEPVAIVIVTAVLTMVTLVLGELAPKRVAMQRAERWALLAARPLSILAALSRPVVWLLGAATDLAVRFAGADPRATRAEVTTEEIRDMIAAQGGFSAEQRTIIRGAFEIAERTLREVVVPRRDVVSLPAGLPARDGVRRLVGSGHSRAPVTGPAGLDDVAGVVHLRDLIGADGGVGTHARPAPLLPETLKVSDAMRQLRAQRQHLALVVDELGAIEGIVTLEDLVEEVVGEIYDETDRDVRAVVHEPGGVMLLTGTFPIHDLPDIGVELDLGDQRDRGYVTVAGLLLARLGHVPSGPGDRVDLGPYTAEVVEVAGHAITRVRLRPHRRPPEPGPTGSGRS
jgi:putative hemolysin